MAPVRKVKARRILNVFILVVIAYAKIERCGGEGIWGGVDVRDLG